MRQCASKDAGSQRGWILGAVPHRLEEGKSAARTWAPKGGRVFKALRGNSNGKAQREQYRLEVDLGRCINIII